MAGRNRRCLNTLATIKAPPGSCKLCELLRRMVAPRERRPVPLDAARPPNYDSSRHVVNRKRQAALIGLVLLLCAPVVVLVRFPGILRSGKSSSPAAEVAATGEKDLRNESGGGLTEGSLRDLLSPIQDPELGVGIVDLGLIDEIVIQGASVEVTIVLTSPFCPWSDYLLRKIHSTLDAQEGIEEVSVRVDRDTVWTIDRMSPAARKKLGVGSR